MNRLTRKQKAQRSEFFWSVVVGCCVLACALVLAAGAGITLARAGV